MVASLEHLLANGGSQHDTPLPLVGLEGLLKALLQASQAAFLRERKTDATSPVLAEPIKWTWSVVMPVFTFKEPSSTAKNGFFQPQPLIVSHPAAPWALALTTFSASNWLTRACQASEASQSD